MSNTEEDLLNMRDDIEFSNTQKEESKPVVIGDFLHEVLSGDVEQLKNLVESDEFQKAKKNKDIHNEIMVALRAAITSKDVAMVKTLDSLFNLNNPKDKKTPYLAALSGIPEIFHVFTRKDQVFKQKFLAYEHPLVAAFKSGNLEIAKWMKNWADENDVPNSVKAEAVNAAASNGNLEILKLYKVSDPPKAGVIANLIKFNKGHLIPHIINDKDDNGNPINDYSYNNFEMLQAVAEYYPALAAMIRHPSLQPHIDRMPSYFRAVHAAEKKKWQRMRDSMINHHKQMVADQANRLHGNGSGKKAAILAAMLEQKPILLRSLADAGLDTF